MKAQSEKLALVCLATSLIAGPSLAKPVRAASQAEIAAAYPSSARDEGVTGEVAMRCLVDSDGRADGCRVVSEIPVGYGFGLAALSLADKYRFSPGPAEADVEVAFGGPPNIPWLRLALGLGLVTAIVTGGSLLMRRRRG